MSAVFFLSLSLWYCLITYAQMLIWKTKIILDFCSFFSLKNKFLYYLIDFSFSIYTISYIFVRVFLLDGRLKFHLEDFE